MAIIHLWSRFTPTDGESKRRHTVARRTWETQPWVERGVEDTALPRLFPEGQRQLPYVRDLIDHATLGETDDTIVILTNADIAVRSDVCPRVAATLQANHALYSFRRDFYHQIMSPIPDADITKGIFYPGCDLFAFRAGWWRAFRHDYPDMVFAREAWDACLRVLVEATNPHKPLALPDLYWHERHANGWEDRSIRYTLPGQRHNLRLAYGWLIHHGQKPASFGIRLP